MNYFFAISILFSMNLSFAADVCSISKPQKSAISSRTKIIKISDGQIITIIGQNHGDRLELRRIMDVVNYKNDSNNLWLWTLNSIKDSNKKAIRNYHEEVEFISTYLKQNPDIKYLGLESTPDTLVDHLKYSEKVQYDLLTEFERRKVDTNSRADLALGFAGSLSYLKLIEPGLFKNRELFGAEGKKESEEHSLMLDKYDSTLKKLKEKIPWQSAEGQSFLDTINQTESELLAIYPSYSPQLDDKILATALGKAPSKYKELVSNWISASLEEMKAMKRRDEKIAESLLLKNGSVLATLGIAHLDSVMSILEKKCRNMNQKSPASDSRNKNNDIGKGVQ